MTHSTVTQMAQLADLLEQATRLARSLSQTKPFKPHIPQLKRPAHVPADQEWFWTNEWQAGEQEVNLALQRGEYKVFDSVEQLLADLHARV